MKAAKWLTVAALMYPSCAPANCLTEVAGFAKEICGDIEKSGISTVLDARGNLDAGISNIVKRIVGGASGQVSGDVLYKTYTGVIQEQLGSDRFNVLTCRQKMVDVAVQQVCTPSMTPKYEQTLTADYVVCIGEHANRCPQGSVYLYCGASVAEWAKKECKSYAYKKLDDVPGNKCGYYTAKVICTNKAVQ